MNEGRRQRMTGPSFGKACLLALAACLPGVPAAAISIPGYDPEVNNRFESGFPGGPVGNTAPGYLGAGLDLSGVGWAHGTGLTGGTKRMQNITLLTPLHVIQPTHMVARPGTPFYFLGADDVLHTSTIVRNATFTTSPANDITVGTLSAAFDTSQAVTPYRVLDVRTRTYAGLPLLIYGSNGNSQGARLAPAVGGTRSGTLQPIVSADANPAPYWESGDSGSPAFVVYTAPNGTRSLTFGGGAWYAGAFNTLQPDGAAYDPVAGINRLTKADGYAVKWTIYENPAAPAATAPVWTGAADTALFNAANWSTGASPANVSVVFDASTLAGGPAALTLPSAGTLRGALFRGDDPAAGFTLSGPGMLSLGQVGLRNEAAAAQTLGVNLRLTDSQNWEAARGNLVVNGGIDTTSGAHLLVIGGSADTTVNGVISGAGALAKDDSGTLTLNAVNTYAGKTWIHNGTLRLGTDNALAATTEVIFDTANSAALDLAGHAQTLASLRSTYAGTGLVNLGGGTLTIDATSASSIYRGSIQGHGDFVKAGAGLLTLGGDNTHSGALRLQAGTLRLASTGALSANASLVISGNAVLELEAGDLAAGLGTGAGQLSFAGAGGFGARGGERAVTLNGGGILTWDQAGFLTGGQGFILGASTSDAMVDFRNSIVLGTGGSGMRNLLATGVGGRISGDLSDGGGTYGINKYNGGLLELSGVNTYKGATVIHSGVLRAASAGALSSASNIVLNGGVLELGHADYAASLGAGAGRVRFTGNGGFSARGADRVVRLDGGAALSWGSGSFVADGASLLFSSAYADATLVFENAIDLGAGGAGARTIQVANGSAAVDARLTGNLTQTGGDYGLIKTGAGTLELTGDNAWTGDTRIQGGALRVGSARALPDTRVVLAGGVLELAHADYAATLGASLAFEGAGGFSAAGADRRVRLDNGAALTWGAGTFVAAGNALLLSSSGADATIVFENAIVLGTSGSATRTIQVADGAAAVDARLAGSLTRTGGTIGLTKTGAGTLELTGANTYNGETRINDGALRIGAAGALSASSKVVLDGGVLELAHGDYTGTLGTHLAFGSTKGGFSAAGATRRVTLNGGAALAWTSETVLSSSAILLFSSAGADATLEFVNPLVISGGPATRTIEVADGSAAVDARLTGVISQRDGDYGLIKTGAGTLELAAANTYKGATRIDEGRLLVTGDLAAATGGVSVASGASLGGTGTVGGVTIIHAGGVLDLAGAPASLTFNDTLTLAADARFRVTLGGAEHSRADVAGQATVAGAWLDLMLAEDFADTATQGMVFTLLSAETLSGTLAQGGTLLAGRDGFGYRFAIGYGDDALTLTLQEITAVPEPARASLLVALGTSFGLLFARRRETRNHANPGGPTR